MFTIKHDIKDMTDDLQVMCYYYRLINARNFLRLAVLYHKWNLFNVCYSIMQTHHCD